MANRQSPELGQVRTPSTPIDTYRINPGAEAFGADVARGLGDLGQDVTRSAYTYAEVQRRSKSYEAEKNFLIWQGTTLRAEAEAEQQAPANFEGYAASRNKALAKAQADFLKTVAPLVAEEFAVKTEAYKQQLMTGALETETRGKVDYQKNTLTTQLEEFQTGIHENPLAAEAYAAEWVNLVGRSALTPQDKALAIQHGFDALTQAQYVGEALGVAQSKVHPAAYAGEGGDVQYSESTVQRALLNTIASVESDGSYNQVVYGGTFDNYGDHPRIYKTREDGRKTSAAGRYQFVASTWDEVSAQLGLTDFSPESQDKAAWHRAQWRFKKETGGDLNAELSSGDRERIKAVRKYLAPEWEGFQNISDDAFANRFLGSGTQEGPGANQIVQRSQAAPDIWNDPRFASIPYDKKFQLERYAQQLYNDAEAERKAAEKAVYTTALNTALVEVSNGRWNEDQVQQAVHPDTGWIKDYDDQQKLLKAWDKYNEDGALIRDFQANLAAPLNNMSYADTSKGGSRQQMDAYYEKFLRAGVQARDPSLLATVLPDIVGKTKMLPPKMMDDLRGMIANGTVQDVNYAMQAMSLFEDAANDAWRHEATEQEVSDLGWWRREGGQLYQADPEDALNRLRRRTDTKYEPIRKIYEEAGKKYIRDGSLTVDSMVDTFGGWLSIDPELPASTYISGSFQVAFEGAFLEEMQRYGDPEKAKAAAADRMRLRWGVTEVGGSKKIMEYAPEAVYPRVGMEGGNHDWIENQARQDLAKVDPRFFSPSFEFILVPDGRTRAEYDVYHAQVSPDLPSYLVFTKDADGMISPVKSGTGFVRWGGAVTPEMTFQVEVDAGRMRTERQLGLVRAEMAKPENRNRPDLLRELTRKAAGLQQTLDIGYSDATAPTPESAAQFNEVQP